MKMSELTDCQCAVFLALAENERTIANLLNTQEFSWNQFYKFKSPAENWNQFYKFKALAEKERTIENLGKMQKLSRYHFNAFRYLAEEDRTTANLMKMSELSDCQCRVFHALAEEERTIASLLKMPELNYDQCHVLRVVAKEGRTLDILKLISELSDIQCSVFEALVPKERTLQNLELMHLVTYSTRTTMNNLLYDEFVFRLQYNDFEKSKAFLNILPKQCYQYILQRLDDKQKVQLAYIYFLSRYGLSANSLESLLNHDLRDHYIKFALHNPFKSQDDADFFYESCIKLLRECRKTSKIYVIML